MGGKLEIDTLYHLGVGVGFSATWHVFDFSAIVYFYN